MAAYLIADIHIKDAEGYEEYRNRMSTVIAAYGGRYVVRGGRCELLEGDRDPGRLVVIEFASMERLKTFYDSSEYSALRALRRTTTTSYLVAGEGV